MAGFPDDLGDPTREELKMDHDVHEDGAARQLAAIQAGGYHLVHMVRQRIGQVLDALDEGDFVETVQRLNEASNYATSLASAQQYLAIADGSKLIRAAELKVGMTLTDVGEVTEVIIEECPAPACRRHISLKIGEHDLKFHGDQEVYVAVDG